MILLAVAVMVAVALSHHVLAPASLSALRGIVARVHADVIATLVKEGGFRTVEDGLTMHIRRKAPDGSFQGIFVDDNRNPKESLQYSAAHGMLLERDGGSFLVLQNGDLVRNDLVKDENSVVAFATYALDLSQLGAPAGAALLKAKERSTFYLLEPEATDPFSLKYPARVAAEIHDRISAPLYPLCFALIALAFLGRPRTSRQDRGYTIAAAVLVCLSLRVAGFAAVAIARSTGSAIALLYLIPVAGVAFGLYALGTEVRLRIPRRLDTLWDQLTARRLANRAPIHSGSGIADTGRSR